MDDKRWGKSERLVWYVYVYWVHSGTERFSLINLNKTEKLRIYLELFELMKGMKTKKKQGKLN